MATIVAFVPANDAGQQLAEMIRPLCERVRRKLVVPPTDRINAHTARDLYSTAELVLWDGSIEDKYIYHLFRERAKRTKLA